MRKLIVLLLFVSFCGGTTEETVPPIETTTTSSTTSTTTSTTTTSSTTTTVPETTTTTVNIEDVILPTVTFPNCPEDQVTESEFQLIFEVTAGNYGVDYLRYSRWKNGEYESRAYFEKANPSSSFDFPLAEEVKQYSVLIENDDTTQLVTYELFVSVSDESNAFFEIEERCKIVFNNIPATTTSTTTTSTTTTIPKSIFPETPPASSWITFSGSGDDVVDVSAIGTNLQILYLEAIKEGENFYAWSLNEDLEQDFLITARNGNISDIYIINYKDYRSRITKYVEIKSKHNWQLVFKPIASARNFEDSSISGVNDEVIEAYGLEDTGNILTISHTGEDNFYIWSYNCNGEELGLITAENGSFSANYVSDKGTCFLEIKSDGEWTISR